MCCLLCWDPAAAERPARFLPCRYQSGGCVRPHSSAQRAKESPITTTLVTGAAGFIGAGVCEQLLARDEQLVGIDNLNAYYCPALKQTQLQLLFQVGVDD